MIVMAVITKFIAAWATQKTFKLTVDERQMIFGLSNARVGATLAVVLVGYSVILGETPAGDPIRLLNEDILNGTIIMILVTCTISSFVVEKASRKIALLETANKPMPENDFTDKILISLAYPETVYNLVDLAFLLQPNKHKSPLYALHVVSDKTSSVDGQGAGKKMMEMAIKHAAATDNKIIPLTRFDLNISNGIVNTIKEHDITDVIIGLHHLSGEQTFFGPVTEKILEGTGETVFIYKAQQPVNTLKRIVAAVAPNAEYEKGFHHWFGRMVNISRETGLPLVIHAASTTIKILKEINAENIATLNITFLPFDDWSEFLIFSREVKLNDLFIIISSRKGYLSYNAEIEKLPKYLTKYFADTSYIIVYPGQIKDSSNADLKPLEENVEVLGKAGEYVKNIFKNRKGG